MGYGLCKPCWFAHVICTCFKETDLLFNVHLSCFANFILCPTGKYIFKVNNNKKNRLICWMYLWHSSGVFTVDVDHSQHINKVFLLLTLNKYLPVGCERQVIMLWKQKKLYICFVTKRPISFSDLSLHRIEIIWTYDHTMNYN